MYPFFFRLEAKHEGMGIKPSLLVSGTFAATNFGKHVSFILLYNLKIKLNNLTESPICSLKLS